jgi:predicted RNA-binding protein with TRAM domain
MRIVDLKIADIAFGGKGVARENGKAVFVPYTIEGETVSAEIVREKKQFAEAELVDVKESSPHRVTPECPYFGRCGGCAYQHIDYEHQLAVKWRQVRDVLQRIGKLKDIPMRPIIPSPKQYGISQSHHRSRPRWRDRFFPTRLASFDRHRALPNFARRGQSRISGFASTTTRERWTLHTARFIAPAGFFANERCSGKCVARFGRQSGCA